MKLTKEEHHNQLKDLIGLIKKTKHLKESIDNDMQPLKNDNYEIFNERAIQYIPQYNLKHTSLLESVKDYSMIDEIDSDLSHSYKISSKTANANFNNIEDAKKFLIEDCESLLNNIMDAKYSYDHKFDINNQIGTLNEEYANINLRYTNAKDIIKISKKALS